MVFIKTASDISRKKVFFCDVSTPLTKVADMMHINNIGSVIVNEGDVVKGITTVNGLLKHMSKNRTAADTRVDQIMSSPVITANKDLEIDKLVDEFNKHKVSRMVLVDNKNKVVGIVRDIAVYKYMTFCKYDKEAKKRFANDYYNRSY
jgi:predicted transcriptional regulator